jgi:hypothetical protein
LGWRHRLGRSADARSIQAHFQPQEEHDVNKRTDCDHGRRRIMSLHLLPPRHVPVPRGRRPAGTLRHARGRGGASRPWRPLRPRLFPRGMRGVLPRQGRGTPHADAVVRPLAALPRGVRPLLGLLFIFIYGRRVVLLRRTGLDAHRRVARLAEQIGCEKDLPATFGRGLMSSEFQ